MTIEEMIAQIKGSWLIDAVVRIGNDKDVAQTIEPDVSHPLELQRWMAVRAIVVWETLKAVQEEGK